MTDDKTPKTPAGERLLAFFETPWRERTPVHGAYLQLALDLVELLKPSPERTVALRKLLESRDEALRCEEVEGQ